MTRLKEVIAFVNNKGGVAKTTTTLCLASALLRANHNFRILVIDLDAQCNASTALGWDETRTDSTVYNSLVTPGCPLPIYETTCITYNEVGAVFLCPAHSFLTSIDVALHMQRPAENVLLERFANPIANHTNYDLPTDISEAFDYIFIDCPPALGDITYNAMRVADGVIVPIDAKLFALDGLSKAISVFRHCQMKIKPELYFRGIVITRVDARSNIVKTIIEEVREKYGEAVFNTTIRENIKVEEARVLHKDLYAYAPYCHAAIDYSSLANEILKTYNNYQTN